MTRRYYNDILEGGWDCHDINSVMITLGLMTGINVGIGYEGPPEDNEMILDRACELITKGLEYEKQLRERLYPGLSSSSD